MQGAKGLWGADTVGWCVLLKIGRECLYFSIAWILLMLLFVAHYYDLIFKNKNVHEKSVIFGLQRMGT